MVKRNNSLLYGLLAGLGLLLFYLSIVSVFQGIQFAFIDLRSLWYLILPLAAGFGTQIGLYTSIKHTAEVTGTVAGTGGLSAGSMVACCSHFLFNIIPIVGFSGVAIFLMKYQPAFLGAGIIANIIGISIMVKHKRGMKPVKGGLCH